MPELFPTELEPGVFLGTCYFVTLGSPLPRYRFALFALGPTRALAFGRSSTLIRQLWEYEIWGR